MKVIPKWLSKHANGCFLEMRILRNIVFKIKLLLILMVLTVNDVAAESLYKFIEPFHLYRYGAGYDLTANKQVSSGQLCINLDLDQKNMIVDTSGSGLIHSYESITNIYKLVDKMNLNASAQYKSLTAEANAELDFLTQVETHRFKRTDIFWSYNMFNTMALKPETLSYKPDVKALLQTGVQGADKFFARCGDTFVIGMKNSGYYYGTAASLEEKTSSIHETKFTFDFKYNGGTSYEAAIAYEKSRVEKAQLNKFKIEVKTSDTTLSGKKPETLNELKKQWTEFTPSTESTQPISLVLAPYSVIGTEQQGVLDEPEKETKLKVLLRALWDLRTMKQEADYILRHENEFAFGLPSNKRIITLRKRNLGWIKKSWRDEYESLLIDTKSCIDNFTETCKKLVNWYDTNPRMTELKLLPQQYKSSCYSDFIVKPDFKGERIRLSAITNGDNEMGGGPVRLASTLSLVPNERQLELELFISAEENKKDHSTFNGQGIYTVFDLDSKHPAMVDFFQGCEFANLPINKKVIKTTNGKAVYGNISQLTKKNPRNYIPFEGNGLLRSMSCEVDGKGKDHNRMACKDIYIGNFQVKLQSKLDRLAMTWSQSKLVKAPSLASLKPSSSKRIRLKIYKKKPAPVNKKKH